MSSRWHSAKMSAPLLLVLVATLAVVAAAPPKAGEKDKHTCQEFTRGLKMDEAQVLRTWHLLHYWTEKTNGSRGDDPSHCVQFVPVTDQERKNLTDMVGKYIENMKWENLSLKMQIPCPVGNSDRTRDYYLERLGDDGSYRTLQMPSSNEKFDIADFHRHLMRLKLVKDQYLGMMDCHEKFVFLLGKDPLKGKLEDHLIKMMDTYGPQE